MQEWLETHGPFDAVIDGANVGLINQHTLSFNQVSKTPRVHFRRLHILFLVTLIGYHLIVA